ncbi:MAG: type II toxin-antitoxin system HicA family toxin [Saprospiraceae bacterium]|nr:type II toxin-antitoxin system HicA family toxin [Saprospiraceae bacterium]MCF8252053.1 type II toxin-antitoxin system HicA family toxin [Saprospiraceae bacterium]MCF8281742.1 type II toxin-antitoxin system HicA family toxin [Bacteroidales bacterium]MCF8310370.1 type II toxin-antitoxin system HicA family toxin [Saprospiraceae bacterium]MCF8439748.1 type II toxin-antitoxin system HicA family toxin [Saprospiraceae bacterium]
MKRKEFLQHLNKHGCQLFREGSRHSIFINIDNPDAPPVAVPRHPTINRILCIHICKQLRIPSPF